MEPSDLIKRSVARIEEAIASYKPVAIFGLFSGGHDSLTCTHIASQVNGFTAAVHINTGIGVDETREFVRDTCRERQWKLLEYKAVENTRGDGLPDPQDYRVLVRRWGFPGPHGHGLMYARLKERQIRRLCRDYKRSMRDKIFLIAGCRSQESERRMRHTKPVDPQGSQVWVNPIHDFTKSDCHNVMAFAGLRRSPVVDLIHKSGECLCGAFAKPGELDELALWFPKKAEEIRALEREIKPIFGWGWEDQPPKKSVVKAPFLMTQSELPLCYNCMIARDDPS
jgi:3'-phosphoadenosine 5'-phosphosulfate sulfotransferase (PAPS reductase)/FAD synthetase